MNQALLEELHELQARGLYRRLRTLSPGTGTHAFWEGREIILFCGNDYLGLSHDPRVIEAAGEALSKYGVGTGAARLISGTSDLHTRLEEELARFKGKERALVFGSGYLANLGILSGLAGGKDLILMDKLCHASLIDGARLSGASIRAFPHKNYSRCEEILEKCRGRYRKALLVSDTVFSMDGDLADLEALARLREKFGALLVVDDAHGIGVFGREGRGVAEGKVLEKIDVVMGTLSKALGVFGGFAAAPAALIDHLVNFSRPFIFATAPPAALMAAALASLRLIKESSGLRERLWKNAEGVHRFLISRLDKNAVILSPTGFREGEESQNQPMRSFVPTRAGRKNELGLRMTDEGAVSPIFPVLIGPETEALRISEALLERGVLIPAIRYPTVPRGKARLRLTVSAAHTEEDLEKLFEALDSTWR